MNYTSFYESILYPLIKRWSGQDPFAVFEQSKKIQSQTRAEIASYQQEKLAQILSHSRRLVPFYRDLYAGLNNVFDLDFFKQLPFVTKADLKSNRQRFLTQGVNKKSLRECRTGGSTGQPTVFYLDKQADSRAIADMMLCRGWWAIKFTDRSANFWGHAASFAPTFKGWMLKRTARLKGLLLNRRIFSAYNMTEKKMLQYCSELEKFNPVMIIGYASTLYVLAQFLADHNISLRLPALKGVVSAAETLYDWQREAIKKVFNVPVINEYGMSEVGIVAYDCPCGSMHTMDQHLYVEVLPVGQIGEGQEQLGEIVLTTFLHYSAPLIRYRTGDMAIIEAEEENCSLGINLQRLKKVLGRVHDLIVRPDGGFIHGEFFTHIFDQVDGVKRFKVIQKDKNKLLIKIEEEDCFDKKQLGFVESKIAAELGSKLTINFDFVENIPLEKSGKYRWVVSELVNK